MLWLVAGCGRVGFEDVDAGIGAIDVATNLSLSTACGATPESAMLPVTNIGTAVVTLTASASGGFVVDAPAAIAPGETAMVSVRAPIAVIGTDRGGQAKTGALTLSTSVGERVVSLSAMVVGANLDVTDFTGAPVVNLSFTSSSCPGQLGVVVTNTGNAPATLARVTPVGYAASGFVSGMVNVGASTSVGVRPLTNGPCAGAFSVGYTVTGQVCTGDVAVPATWTISSTSCLCS